MLLHLDKKHGSSVLFRTDSRAAPEQCFRTFRIMTMELTNGKNREIKKKVNEMGFPRNTRGLEGIQLMPEAISDVIFVSSINRFPNMLEN